MADESRKASLLQIVIASCEKMREELERNGRPSGDDLKLAFDLKCVVRRAGNALEKLNEHRS